MNSNDPIDGAGHREKAVAEGAELRERAVEHARRVGDALGLKEAPVSPDAPPPHPAPRVPAPPYPRALKETLPSTPRAIARQVAESLAPLVPVSAEVEPVSAAAAPGASTPTATADGEPDSPPKT